jgi:serine/threonine protein kinase
VKIFKDEAQGATAERLTREVQIGLACRCPQLIRYFDHDIAATQLGDQPFVVMEWFSGSTLEQLAPQIIALSPLRRRRHLRSVLCQALHGLQYLHQRGVVHRDLQRRNILVASNGAVKIIDFGTAKHAAPSDITERWEEIGTRRYWPPEYFRYVAAPDAWDVAGDLFMLASCLVHAYTGKFIFAEADNYQKFFARLQEYALEYKTNIPELETCKSWMSRSLYGALNIMLSPRPDDRTDATTLIKLLSGNFTRVAKRLPRDAFPLTALVWSLSSEQESLATALLDYFGDRFGAQEAPHMAANDLHFLDQFRRLTGKSIISLVRRFVLFGL